MSASRLHGRRQPSDQLIKLGDLAISGGHGNAQEEYVMRRRRKRRAGQPHPG